MLREDIVNKLSKPMNISLNKEMNENIGYGHELSSGVISTDESIVKVLVLPTDEEVMIARDTYSLSM